MVMCECSPCAFDLALELGVRWLMERDRLSDVFGSPSCGRVSRRGWSRFWSWLDVDTVESGGCDPDVRHGGASRKGGSDEASNLKVSVVWGLLSVLTP